MENAAGVLTHNVVPLYAEARSGSEQISQGLLGETVQILAQAEGFVHVRTADDYTGWVRNIHLRAVESDDTLDSILEDYPNARYCLVGAAFADLWAMPDRLALQTKLVWGSRVIQLERVHWRTGTYAFILMPSGSFTPSLFDPFTAGYVLAETLEPSVPPLHFLGEEACELAHRFIGTPYLWGGGTPFGFDCSGFVQRIYSVLGVTIPRDAYLQAQSPLGTFREPGKTLKAGDLVFFVGQSDPRGRGITHVGMALDNRHFIHANSRTGVVVSAFDDPDIQETYTYRGAWRLRLSRVRAARKV